MRLAQKLKLDPFGARSVPPALLLLCVLAYGLLIPFLGFFWDDWPWIWLKHLQGGAGFLSVDRLFRPLAGEILWSAGLIAGQSPVAWQILSLIARFLAALALFWMLRQLWPGRLNRQVWIAFLFLVYPAFTQQFVAINSLRHILPLAFYFLSIGLMLQAVRANRKPGVGLHLASLAVMLIAMLSTDYYYGLELLRPAFLWIAIHREQKTLSARLKAVLLAWAPYLAGFIAIALWRIWISQTVNYPVTYSEEMSSDPAGSLGIAAQILARNVWQTFFAAWASVFEFPASAAFGQKKTIFYWLLVAGCFVLGLAYLLNQKRDNSRKQFWPEAISLGLLALVVAGLPFLLTGLSVGLNFPSNRLTLPMAFGSSLLLVGLLDLLPCRRLFKILAVSLVVALAVGVQYRAAASYQQDWSYQQEFLRQLTWRVPGLEPNTALLTTELPNSYSTDNSLTAPLNWIYAPQLDGKALPYLLLYLELRRESTLPSLAPGLPIQARYGEMTFSGSTDRTLLVYYAPPACLRVFNPQYEAHYPRLNDWLAEAMPLSNLDVIQAAPATPASLPGEVFDPESETSWCYYFQKADLARQMEDWQKVAEIGEIAFRLDDSPNHASERVPFIQGYAYTGNWERAVELTAQTIEINKFMGPMLCDTWQDILRNAAEGQAKDAAVQAIQAILSCPNLP